jgi:hypothetical protein
MSFERDQDEREDEEIRKAFAEKDAQIEQLQARIAALESVCRRLIEIDDGVYELPGDAWKRDGNEMKKKKPRAKSYQEINRALDAALAKCGEPKLTFSKGISASARAAEARRAR